MSSEQAALPVLTDLRALVAIDLGAESCRISLLRFDPDGAPRIELLHRFGNRAVQRLDGLRWDISTILEQLCRGLEICATQAPEGIRSIAVDGWAVDYIRLDPNSGRPVADPFCYRDPRTAKGEQTLHEQISPARMRELTGIQLLSLNTVYQMASENLETRKLPWLNLPEYVLYRLGARPISELTNASHTQMLGLDGKWSEEILAALDIPLASMPEIVPAGSDVGSLSLASLTCLPAFADTRLIAPACHDTASAIAAIPDSAEDWAYISSGTWSLVGTLLNEPLNTPEASVENFSNFSGVDSSVCFHKNVNGMWLIRQCLESWNSELNGSPELTIGQVVTAAAAFAARDYVLDVDDLDLLAHGNMPQRINGQLRRRGLPEFSTTAADSAELASFIFHSLAARYAAVLLRLETITGRKLLRLYIMGGGSQNKLLNELTAKATGLEVIQAGTECSTIGNFARQLATLNLSLVKRPTALWASILLTTDAADR